jgi:hypothetical protein
MFRFLQRLENFERNYPRIFWLCTSLLGFFLFHEPVQTSSQSQVVIEQLRGGTRDSEKINSLNKQICLRKRKNFDPAFHRRLKKYFPDWDERMAFQKKQEGFYKSAMQKKREALRLRLKAN